jgi:hypothetical protein
MKNNLILGCQDLKKVLKSMLFVVGLFVVVAVDAKPGKSQTAAGAAGTTSSTATGTSTSTSTSSQAGGTSSIRTTTGTTSVQQASMPANLSGLGQVAWQNYVTADKLANFLQNNRAKFTPNDIKVLELRVQEFRDAEKVSSQEQLIISLQKQLAQQTVLLEKLMAGGGALNLGRAPIQQIGWGEKFTGILMTPVAGIAYGLNSMAAWMKSSTLSRSDKIAQLVEFWKGQLLDEGKYPTVKSRKIAINEDVINTSKGSKDEIEDSIYVAVRAELESWATKKGDQYFKDNPNERSKEKIIDDLILAIRADYNRDENNLQAYLNDLSAANINKAGMDKCRAMVSEFLRTKDVLELQEEAARIIAAEKTAAGKGTVQPKAEEKSWWEKIKSQFE